MLTVAKTALLAGLSKARVYLVGGGMLVLIVLGVLWRAFSAGQQSERLGRATTTLNQYKKEARIEADIRSLGADAARERLRAKWRKR